MVNRVRALRPSASTILALGLLLLGLLLVGGCSLVSVSDTSHYNDGEGRLPETIFAEIKPNLTSKAWVLAHFGQPVSVQQMASGEEIYNYQFTRTHRRSATLLFLVRYRGVEQDREYFHVVFDNDLVEKHWIDKLAIAQVGAES